MKLICKFLIHKTNFIKLVPFAPESLAQGSLTMNPIIVGNDCHNHQVAVLFACFELVDRRLRDH
jgi:hypothetical protein